MCRLYGFLANEKTKVECTLVQSQNSLLLQSRSDIRGKNHSDGWGIGFYENDLPQVEKRVTAAYSDNHFSTAAERVFARAVIAHVRKATVGELNLANTHPFTVGAWTFAHNGTIRKFDRVEAFLLRQTKPALLSLRQGETDSESMFLWLLSQLAQGDRDLPEVSERSDLEPLIRQLGQSLVWLAQLCRQSGAEQMSELNFLLTNGSILLAARFNQSLYLVKRRGIWDCEICGIPHVHRPERSDYRAVEVASEPMSHESWEEIPNRTVLGINPDLQTSLYKIP